SVSRRRGVVKRRAIQVDTTTLRPSANRATAAMIPVTLARKVYGSDSVTVNAYGRKASPFGYGGSVEETPRAWVWPGFGGTSSWNAIGAARAAWNLSISPSFVTQPNVIETSAWPRSSAMNRCTR